MLTLSGVGHINPQNTFSWLLGFSEIIQIKPKKKKMWVRKPFWAWFYCFLRLLKAFKGLIWPTTDSINMVGWHGVSFNTFSTLGISFVGNNCVKQGRIFEPFLYIKNEFWENNWVKQGFGILFGLDLIGFWDSQEPTEGVLRVDKAYTW